MMRYLLEPLWIYSIKNNTMRFLLRSVRRRNSIWDKQQSALGLKTLICSIHGRRLTPLLQYNCFMLLSKWTAENATPALIICRSGEPVCSDSGKTDKF